MCNEFRGFGTESEGNLGDGGPVAVADLYDDAPSIVRAYGQSDPLSGAQRPPATVLANSVRETFFRTALYSRTLFARPTFERSSKVQTTVRANSVRETGFRTEFESTRHCTRELRSRDWLSNGVRKYEPPYARTLFARPFRTEFESTDHRTRKLRSRDWLSNRVRKYSWDCARVR